MYLMLRLCWLFVPLVGNAASTVGPLEIGDYATEGGWGHLSIKRDAHSDLRFQIHAIGANRHSCDLEGSIEGNTGRATEGDVSFPPCLVAFERNAAAITVGVSSDGADNFQNCRSYCGMRAIFEGTYVALPPGCESAERRRSHDGFLRLYQSGDYAKALEVVRTLQTTCGKFLAAFDEVDSVHNDAAITLHHLGDDNACLQELAKTKAAMSKGEAELRKDMAGAPADFDLYLPVAKATWFNLKVCRR